MSRSTPPSTQLYAWFCTFLNSCVVPSRSHQNQPLSSPSPLLVKQDFRDSPSPQNPINSNTSNILTGTTYKACLACPNPRFRISSYHPPCYIQPVPSTWPSFLSFLQSLKCTQDKGFFCSTLRSRRMYVCAIDDNTNVEEPNKYHALHRKNIEE